MESLKVVFICAIIISSFGESTAQNDDGVELTDHVKHASNGQSIYHFFEKRVTFNAATSTCNKFGGFVAHIKTQEVWQFIKDNIDERTSGDYFETMAWIGLNQVGNDNNKWEWSDGTPLEGGKNNQNWFKGDTDDPNMESEKCAGAATVGWREISNRKFTGILAKWGDLTCSDRHTFICENAFGSGFVTKETALVGTTADSIYCTVFGDTSCSATWYRNGAVIPNNTDERIYQQQIDENTEYRTSTITFANPLQSDEGNYICSLKKENSETKKDFTVQLETNKFLERPRISRTDKISETENITCTARGRPIPAITWKIGDVDLERNDQIFQVFNTINENTLTSESVFSIINPISFEGNTQLSCVAEGKNIGGKEERKESTLDIGAVTNDAENEATFSWDTNEEICNKFKGKWMKDSGRICKITIAEMVETEEEKCEGSELSIQIRDFTETATTYNLTVTENGNVVDKRDSDKPWKDEKMKISELNPRTEYTFKLTYKPKYWKKMVDLTKTFQTKGKIPGVIDIIGANITTDNKCEVEFRPPSNIKTSQLVNITVFVTETSSPNHQNSTIFVIPYKKDVNTFKFETTNNQSTYKFTTKLVTCADDIGNETEIIECIKAPEMMETEEEKCEGSELSIQIRDFTETATNYSLTVTESGNLVDQRNSDKPWKDGKIKVQKLKPRTKYTLKLTYKPKYWRKSVILTKTFQTKGKIPGVMDIIGANITTDNKCEVEFRPPSNVKTSQLQIITVNITETSSPNHQNSTTFVIPYKKDVNTFKFETTNDQSTYKFTTKLVTCADDVGNETEVFECSRAIEEEGNVVIVISIVSGVLIIIIILIIFIGIVVKRRKRTNQSSGDVETTNIPLVKFKRKDYENVHMLRNRTTHAIDKRNMLETYKSMMTPRKQGFIFQFEKLKSSIEENNFSLTISRQLDNDAKNRYRNILPYDETRVILSTDDGSSDYINASWINGYGEKKKRFIAAQGPTPETIDDFWRMIYETDCNVIVMLTNLIEGGEIKCEQYWPEQHTSYKSGNLTIKFTLEKRLTSYVVRTFIISQDKMRKKVMQYQFISWPDHEIPEITSPFLRFYNEAMEYANEHRNEISESPVVVHCSAGAGRTGTFIAYDILKEMLNNEDYVDIYQTVFDLRLQRMDMVQTVDQFAFLHKLVVETHLLGNTDYTFEEFLKLRFDKHKYMESIRKDFSRFSTIPVTDDSQTLAYGRDLDHFNRDPNILPYNRTRVISSQTTQQTDDVYFNGSWIKNFRDGRKVISAQTPIPSTIETFLNIIAENSVSVVVMISEKGEEGLYWPTNGASARFGEVVVQNTSEIVDQNSTTRKLKVFSTPPNPKNIKVQQIVIESWKDTNLSDDESDLLCSNINKLVQQIDAEWNDNSTILIHCKDGSSFCGSLCALLQVNERLKMENKVDLFRVVKDLRDMRPQMVRTLGQYDICHQVTESFIQSLQTYANF